MAGELSVALDAARPAAASSDASRSLSIDRVIAFLVMAVAAAYAADMLWHFPHWTVDDGYILFRYSANLAYHLAPTYNLIGAHAEGFTGVGQMALLALGIKLGIEPHRAAGVIGILSFALSALVLYRVLRLLAVRPLVAAAPVAFLLLTPIYYTHAFSGLETNLFMLSLLTSIYLAARWEVSHGDRLIESLLLGAVLFTSLVRPEGVVVAAGVLVLMVWRRAAWKDGTAVRATVTRAILVFGLPAAIYMAWRLWYFGHLFPNSFYVKAGTGGTIPGSVVDLFNVSIEFVIYPLCAGILLLGARLLTRHSGPGTSVSLGRGTLLLTAGVLVVMGIEYAHTYLLMGFAYRFYAPYVPLAFLVIAAWSRGIVVPRGLRSVVPLILMVAALGLAVRQVGYDASVESQQTAYASAYLRLLQQEHIPAGRWLHANFTGSDWLVVSPDAGATPYYAGMPTIDMGALNDTVIADSHVSDAAKVDYVFAHRPAVMVLTSLNSTEMAALSWPQIPQDPRFKAGYRLVHIYNTDAPGWIGYSLWIYVRSDLPQATAAFR